MFPPNAIWICSTTSSRWTLVCRDLQHWPRKRPDIPWPISLRNSHSDTGCRSWRTMSLVCFLGENPISHECYFRRNHCLLRAIPRLLRREVPQMGSRKILPSQHSGMKMRKMFHLLYFCANFWLLKVKDVEKCKIIHHSWNSSLPSFLLKKE